MPAPSTPSGLNPATRPRWPKLIVGPDGITVVGTHRSFRRRIALYYGARAAVAVLVVFTALATAGVATAKNTQNARAAHLLDTVCTFHGRVLQQGVDRAVGWQDPPEQMKYVYFLSPLALALALAVCLPLVDPLLLPLVRKTTRLVITPHHLVVRGWGPARGEYPLGNRSTLYLNKEPHPKLDRLKTQIAERLAKQQKTTPDAIQQRWIRWHEDMRDLLLTCGQREVRVARFVNEKTCTDFLLVCNAAIAHMRGET